MEKSYWILISLAIVIAVSQIDAALKQDLVKSSEDLTLALQQTSNKVVDWIFIVVESASLWLVLLIPLYCMSTDGIKASISIVVTVGFSFGVSELLRMSTSEKRPYWVNQDILAISCSEGYDAISRNAVLTASVYSYFAYYCYERRRRGTALALLIGIVVVGYGQVFLGANYYDQVIMGWCFGPVIITFALYADLEEYMKYDSEREHVRIISGILFFLVSVLFVGGSFLSYALADLAENWDALYAENIFVVRYI